MSGEAKDLIKKMMKVNPKERLDIKQCLDHPWFKKSIQNEINLDNKILSNLEDYSKLSNLNKVVMNLIVKILPDEHIEALTELFHKIDTDHSGTIEYEELKHALDEMK